MALDDLALPCTRVMPNGICLNMLPDAGKGTIRFDILIKGGYGVQEKPLQAMFVNRMLREGAGGLSAAEVSRRLDYYGAWVDMYSSQNCNHITLYTLSKHFLPLLELLETMLKQPDFPEENLETIRRNNKSFFTINSQKVDIVSQRHFEHLMWGAEHPLGHIVEPSDYDAISTSDLWSYYNRVYNSGNCTLFIGGTFDDEILDAVESRFGLQDWGCGGTVGDVGVPAPVSLYGACKITIEGTMQSAVKIGFMTLPSSHPDFFKFRILTVLLGGYFGSRLMSNVREENGYTYHISAEIDAYGSRNAFMISSETATEYVAPLVEEVKKELRRLVEEPIPATEVELVRNYILGELCREYEGLSAKSEVFINAWLSGETFESVNDYLNTVKGVTAEELQDVARKYLSREDLIEVVAGA